ncbi:DUF4232 domain-containing protein [Agromyces agglutinans]|nr:DUF4232 domain-containing protein [Agromyces agglutinans]
MPRTNGLVIGLLAAVLLAGCAAAPGGDAHDADGAGHAPVASAVAVGSIDSSVTFRDRWVRPLPPVLPAAAEAPAGPAVGATSADADAPAGAAVSDDAASRSDAPDAVSGASGGEVPHCLDENLRGEYVARPHDSGAGQFFGDLVFSNLSPETCWLRGWPGLVAEDADGNRLGWPAGAEGTDWEYLELAPHGGRAVALLHGSQPGAYGCPETTSTRLRAFITSDGAGAGIPIDVALPVCADSTSTLGVGPLLAG